MKRRLVTSMIALVLLAVVSASPASAAAPSGSGRVGVSVVPRSMVVCTVVDQDHVDMRSNAPWRLTMLTQTGTSSINGVPTRGDVIRIELPAGTEAWWVELDSARK